MILQPGETYITASQLRARFGGRSDMWLWRLLNDTQANFPKPVVIRRNRYWALSEVEAWLEACRDAA
jgi:predicted DNA-binding transcriptional regulator AlpA